jgi:uncharacterized protein (TIGR00255 family)
MTGYGRAEATLHDRVITVELRSVNNRYFDCTVKMPKMYLFAEEAMKTQVQGSISRGKVDVYLTVDQKGMENVTVTLNRPVAEGYYHALLALGETFDLKNDVSISTLARFPDVFVVEKASQDMDEMTSDLVLVLKAALKSHTEMRMQEGRRLADDINKRLLVLSELIQEAEVRSPKTVSEYRLKLEQRMRELLEHTEIEEARLLTEAAFFADKIAVNEEIVRLRSHIEQVSDLLGHSGPVGRKLDFLMQELNREANTLGSKGNDVEMARIVVNMKAEIEKMREQVQNIE